MSVSDAFVDPFALPLDPSRYDRIAAWRRRGSILPGVPPVPEVGESYYVLNRDLAERTLRHKELLQAPLGRHQDARRRMSTDPVYALLSQTMLMSDPPRHGLLRRPIAGFFAPTAVVRFEPRLREIANELVRSAAALGEFDIVGDFAAPFAVKANALMLGIEIPEPTVFKQWTAAISYALDLRCGPGPPTAESALGELAGLARAATAKIPRRESLLRAMVEERDHGRWSHDEMIAACVLLLFGGQETVADAIGNALLALAQHPEEATRIRTGLPVTGAVVDELLRYDSSVQFAGFRVAARDLELDGVSIPAGSTVTAMLGSAHRDEAWLGDADRLDLTRDPAPAPLVYGHGPHICLGQHLARHELAIAVSTFCKVIAEWHVAEAEVGWRPNILFRGPLRAPARVG